MKKSTRFLLFILFTLSLQQSFAQPGKLHLGNAVWNDSDGDGKKDANEYGIGGITVSLYTDNDSDDLPDGAAIRTYITRPNGNYSFENLVAGRYIISIPVIAGYRPGGIAPTSNAPDNDIDNDNNGVRTAAGILYSNAITLSEGGEPATDGDGANSNLTFDIALCGNSAIGDLVWYDANCNGIQDAGEAGINGALVTITYADGTTETEISHNYNGVDGYYDFINMGPGTYKITFATPAGYTASPSNNGTDDSKDSDPINSNVMVTIGVDESDFTIDAGFCKGQNILNLGNIVWNDADGDGKRDPNEYGIGGITVSLYTDNNADDLPDGAAIATVATTSTGMYLFTGLAAGRYIISIPIIAGYRAGGIASTSYAPDNNIDNDNNGVRSNAGILYTKAITLSAGDEPVIDGDGSNGNLTLDIALCGNSAIGDFVWSDANCNGIQDAGEVGINGATVAITYPDGTIKTVVTHNYLGRDGYYDFINIGPGTYKITFSTPVGYSPISTNVGSDDTIDSDPVNGEAFSTIAADKSDFTIDAGYCQAAGNLTLGNLVWNDADGDGKKDDNEYAIGGITVSLYTDDNGDNVPDGEAIKTTVSGVDGFYRFTGLAAGRYIISIPILPGYVPGGITGTSNDPDNNIDNDNNGVRRSGDILYSNAITLSAGVEPTNDGDGSNGNLTFDIALCGNSAIGDFVWHDLNCNGIQDAGEPGINDVSVTITYADGTTKTVVTHNYNGKDGYYDFINIGPGTYTIAFTTPTGYTPTSSNAGNNDAIDSDPVNGTATSTIAANESDFTIDAGYCKGGTLRLGNLVWNDADGDGKKDDNEYAIGGITVSLYTNNNADNLPDGGAIRTTITGVDGIYSFTGLAEGRYIISIPILPGYVPGGVLATSANPDNDVDNDNNGVKRSGDILYSNAITLTAGGEPTADGDDNNSNLTFDIALCGNSAIGDFVWFDMNCNGIQDAGEPGINNATVTITYADGTTKTVVTHNYNGRDGYYDFINIGPGTYKITFTTPAGYRPAPSNIGSNDELDSDPVDGTSSTTIAADQSDFTIDAGFCKGGTMSLGNLVWNDADGDGKKDQNEYVLIGITVSLYTDSNADNLPDGPAFATTMTGQDGFYHFDNLAPGRYIISIPILPGYVPGGVVPTSADPDNNIDNDNNGVRRSGDILYSNAITLSAGGEPTTDGDGANSNLTFDIALCGNSAIGDFVWYDLNCNGIQDAGEPGINDVEVTVTYADGTTKTVLTHNYLGTDGYYDFINIGPGTYTIKFTTPAGYSPSPVNIGLDDTKDSDPINGTTSTTIAANESDFTIDAGFCAAAGSGLRLGNLVWNDLNDNGKKDTNEPGVTGAAVNLYADANGDNAPDGAPIASTVTVNGFYGFSGLSAGKYIVGVTIPAGYTKGAAVATGNDPDNNVDSDNNGVSLSGNEIRTKFITLSTGDEPTNDGDDANGNLTLDIALKGGAVIGDYVWSDVNQNGIQDPNEVGIANAVVNLVSQDGTIRTSVTNAAGLYSFNAVGPGTYTVQFITPSGMTPSPSNVGNDAKDSDPVIGEVSVTLVANETNNTIDAGFYRSACIASSGTCGPGYLTLQTSLIRNGDFSAPIVSPAAGNAFTGTAATPGVAYNFAFGSFLAQAGYAGTNVRPTSENSFSIINTSSAFTAAGGINQLPFPGDPANSVAASTYFMYHNGNNLGGKSVIWQQTTTGLVLGKNYKFRFYVSNMYEPATSLNSPQVEIVVDGTGGTSAGTSVAGPVTIDEATTSNAAILNGWKRVEYSFTATSVTMTFEIVNAQLASEGNELALAAIGIEVCEKDADGDCVTDIDDIDDDNDGILDIVENGGYDALQDCDNDGVANYLDTTPGCATPSGTDHYGNPFQPLTGEDCNNDGIVDFFDWDRDGIINELDLDSDNDGILDVQETRDVKATDNNRDGMVDGVDNDNDGLLSSADVNDSDPSIAASIGLIPQDFDRDSTPNYLDLDSDGDGIADNREALELDVFAAAYTGLATGTNDNDRDGVRTVNYTLNDNDADNFNGFGAKGILLRDNDGDGHPNPYDIDSDNDGITDNVEGQPTCSEMQPFGTDTDGDGLDDAYDTDNNSCIRRAAGITPYDKDFDGTPDIRDLDTDNDSAPDVNEGSGISGDFVTNFNDSDEDGLIDQFDVFDIKTATALFVNNVAHSNMGPNGNFDGPLPPGSNAKLPQSQPGDCPNADRDWRNIAILPVSLVDFKGVLTNQVVRLTWTVENEINMSHYIVERSTNGQDFTDIARIAARGNSTVAGTYTTTDDVAGLNAATVYYRLKEVETTGSSKISNVLSFKLSDKGNLIMSVFPNPARNFFVLRIAGIKEGAAVIRLMDMAGKAIISTNKNVNRGVNAITFDDIYQLSAGTYNVQVIVDGQVYNQKLMLVK